MSLPLGTQQIIILVNICQKNIYFCRVIFFSLATPDIITAFRLLITDANSEKLLERL